MPSRLAPSAPMAVMASTSETSGSVISSRCSCSLDERLTASVCTVRQSGSSFISSSIECCMEAASSPGSPAMRSIFMQSKPSRLAILKQSTISDEVWSLPTLLRVASHMVCGFIEILVTPISRMTRSFSSVIVSGRPASTVNSVPLFMPYSRTAWDISRSSSPAVSTVGVPPPR